MIYKNPKNVVASDITNFLYPQLHAGTFKSEGELHTVFHTNSDGRWWSGWMFDNVTPKDLLEMARSIERDLLILYPNLK